MGRRNSEQLPDTRRNTRVPALSRCSCGDMVREGSTHTCASSGAAHIHENPAAPASE